MTYIYILQEYFGGILQKRFKATLCLHLCSEKRLQQNNSYLCE